MMEHALIIQTIRDALNLSVSTDMQLTPVLKGGSDRAFYRVQCGGGTYYIFMQYSPDRTENIYYAAIADYLCGIGVRAPRLFHHDPIKHYILMEDLGEEDLWSFRGAPWEKRRLLYKAALSEILKLHACDVNAFKRKRIQLMPGFDAALYRWEHDYFREHFVKNVCGIALSAIEEKEITSELAFLTEEMSRQEYRLIHRDFQSQNIIVRDGRIGLIDFQGMRFGSPFYDLGSLLYDPYVSFTEEERMELLAYYHREAKTGLPLSDMDKAFRAAATQRLMQALGAYGFLGIGKGMIHFLAYIPSGLENLIDASGRAGFLTALQSLALRCREAVQAQSQSEGNR
jgi:aminoglycoside/choline kinase family phosphotransferase